MLGSILTLGPAYATTFSSPDEDSFPQSDFQEYASESLDVDGADALSDSDEFADSPTPYATPPQSAPSGNEIAEQTVNSDAEAATQPSRAGRVQLQSNGSVYDSLEDAIAQATNGDTLLLLDDLVLTEQVTIPGHLELTLDLQNNTLISQIDPSQASALVVNEDGSFTLQNGKMTGGKANANGYTGGAVRLAGQAKIKLVIENIEASNFTSQRKGGVLFSSAESAQITINRSNFHHNRSADNGGGAIYMNGNDQNSYMRLNDTTLKENLATGSSRVDGGAVAYVGAGEFSMTGSTVENNEVHSTDDFYGFKYAQGGGLSITGPLNAPAGNLAVHLEDNVISGNKAQVYGGAIYFELSANNGDTLSLVSGRFEDNYSAFAGGAIDYSIHNQPPLELKSVMMTGNSAVTGAGIWLCPAGKLDSHSTLGGYIVGNTLTNAGHPSASGTDIRFEGSDSVFGASDNNPEVNRVTVSPRDFTGNLVRWYADEMGALYQPGDPLLSTDYYTQRHTSFGLYGEGTAPDLTELENQAKLIFRNNQAAFRGGAISSNSPIVIGDTESKEKELTVHKVWKDESGKEMELDLPESIEVTLMRHDDHGGSYALETVELNPDNQWSHHFVNLPAYGTVNDYPTEFTYDIVETTDVPGFELTK
ncbi:MAG: Cna B-type domain-containing protein, partial [Actinomycetaceae bacterium]|nr:Cna B-type domain-containing protein [Actinomycetaceae bacterium]